MATPFSPLSPRNYFLEVIDLSINGKKPEDNKTDGKIVPLLCFSTRILKQDRRRERLKVPAGMRVIGNLNSVKLFCPPNGMRPFALDCFYSSLRLLFNSPNEMSCEYVQSKPNLKITAIHLHPHSMCVGNSCSLVILPYQHRHCWVHIRGIILLIQLKSADE